MQDGMNQRDGVAIALECAHPITGFRDNKVYCGLCGKEISTDDRQDSGAEQKIGIEAGNG